MCTGKIGEHLPGELTAATCMLYYTRIDALVIRNKVAFGELLPEVVKS